MHNRIITRECLEQYGRYLIAEEKSPASQEKYMRDLKAFLCFSEGRQITKELVLEYKAACIQRGYAVRSIISMLASINSFLLFVG
jgi:site-specific recombinase XerD